MITVNVIITSGDFVKIKGFRLAEELREPQNYNVLQ
jgi:hypothetical protein